MSTRINDATSRGDHFDTRLREPLSDGVCPARRELIDSETDSFSFLPVETYRVRGIQEEIATALGFCMKHGARLKQFAEKSYQITFLSSELVHDILGKTENQGSGFECHCAVLAHVSPKPRQFPDWLRQEVCHGIVSS